MGNMSLTSHSKLKYPKVMLKYRFSGDDGLVQMIDDRVIKSTQHDQLVYIDGLGLILILPIAFLFPFDHVVHWSKHI